MSSRPRIHSVVVVALVAASIAACSLQTNGLDAHDIGDDATFDASGPTLDGSLTNADGAVAFPDGATDPDATTTSNDANASPDTPIQPIDASTVDASAPDAEAGNPCDVDGDGHKSKDSTCLGDDCCDTDANVHPGQTGWFATRNACTTFDYDCNNAEDAEHGTVDCKLGFFDCSGDGFDAPTACGVTAIYSACSYAGFGCNHDDDMRAQRCH